MMMSVRAKFLALHKSLNAGLVDREEEVSCILVAMIANEHVLLVGPPGTAKSLICDQVSNSLTDGKTFQRLLAKHSEPADLFGPISLSALKADRYEHVTTGFLSEAHTAFIDEIGKASPAIINQLLTIMNERQFDNGPNRIFCPLRLLVAASNEWPIGEGYETCGAMFDRFLIRKMVRYVSPSSMERMIWSDPPKLEATLTVAEWDQATAQAMALPWSEDGKTGLLEILDLLRREGIRPSDRRCRKCTRIAQAAAWLSGASEVRRQDLEVLQHVLWEDPIEHPQKVADTVIGVANPGAQTLSQSLVEADELIQKINPRKVSDSTYGDLTKLKEICDRLKGLPGERAQMAFQEISKKTKELTMAVVG